MTKVKLISCLSMFALSLSMLVMGVLALATQTITLTGEVGFNIADKSVYVKDARISDETITGFMPGYINDGLILSDAIISGSSFEISLDVINTTTNNFDIVIESSQSGVSVTTEAYIPANSTDLTEITSSTPITETIVLTVTNSTSSPVDLTNILIKIEERTFTVLDGFVFRSNGTGTGELVSYTGTDAAVRIPDTYSTRVVDGETIFIEGDDYTVTAIADSSTGAGTFYNSNITSVVIPDSVTSIGKWAFYSCDNLTSIIIPDSVTSIGDYAFLDCYALAEVYNYSPSITVNLGETSYSNNGYLGQYAKVVYNASNLTGEKPETRITVVDNMQYYNYRDDFIALAPAVTRETLTEVTLDNRTTEINQHAFYDCSSLTSITIPDSVTNIGGYAFQGCSSLTSITIPDSVTSIGSSAFSYCSSLTSITIPEGVTSIGNQAFQYCNSLTSITIPDTVTSIGQYAFSGCSSLTSITIPDIVTTIGISAFSGCSSLTSITIPDIVTTIGTYAFSGCSSLTSVTFKETEGWRAGTTPISASALANTTTAATYLTSEYKFETWTRS